MIGMGRIISYQGMESNCLNWYAKGNLVCVDVEHRTFIIAKCLSHYQATFIADAPKIICEDDKDE